MPTCCVVGAGAAGLLSAALLAERGWKVAIHEARDRIGGRVARATVGGVPVDLGAEFSHGRGAVFRHLEAAGLPLPRALFSHDEEADARLRPRLQIGGTLVDGNGRAHEVTAAMRALWDDVIVDDGWASDERPDASFAELAASRGLGADALRALDAYCAVEYATSLDLLGVKEWRRRELEEEYEARRGDDEEACVDYQMEGRYAELLEAICARATSAGAALRLRAPVRRVCASPGCGVDVDGERYDGAIVTVPISVLQSGGVELGGVRPGLGEAIARVQCRAASKVIVALSHKVWARAADADADADADAGWGQMLLSAEADAFARQVWMRESGGVCLAVGFLAGPRDAAAAERLTTEEAAARLLAQLRRAYGWGDELRCVDALKVDWGADEWARGGYSSPSVGASGVWRELRETGAPQLLLAGEAVHPRGSTVCSALESAEWAARTLAATGWSETRA